VANVVTYVAIVGFANVDGKLLPGMTANVRVVTEERQDVLKVPNSALRVRLAGIEPPDRAKGQASAASGAASGDKPVHGAGEAVAGAHKPRPAGEGQMREAGRTSTRGRIYVNGADGKPKALNVRLGVSDGSMTELLLGPNAPAELKEGAEVIAGTKSATAGGPGKTPGAGPRPPF
jgi:HlyD family secretion protein